MRYIKLFALFLKRSAMLGLEYRANLISGLLSSVFDVTWSFIATFFSIHLPRHDQRLEFLRGLGGGGHAVCGVGFFAGGYLAECASHHPACAHRHHGLHPDQAAQFAVVCHTEPIQVRERLIHSHRLPADWICAHSAGHHPRCRPYAFVCVAGAGRPGYPVFAAHPGGHLFVLGR